MNRRDALKMMLLASVSATILPDTEVKAEAKPDFGRGLFGEADSFVDYMQREAVGKPQALVVGRPKSGKTTIINMLKRELYPDAHVYGHAASACFPRAGYPTFIEANLSRSALTDVAYGGDVFAHMSMVNWENVCSADIVLLTFTSTVAVAGAPASKNGVHYYVTVLKNRCGDVSRIGQWRVG